jgi:hypothetical protein
MYPNYVLKHVTNSTWNAGMIGSYPCRRQTHYNDERGGKRATAHGESSKTLSHAHIACADTFQPLSHPNLRDIIPKMN